MLEIEVKYRCSDFTAVEQKLHSWNSPMEEERTECDRYYRAPHRDFARTDEALRIRKIGPINFLTYKGPRIDAATKTRQEVEVQFADGAATNKSLGELFEALGFTVVAALRKRRRVFVVARQGFDLHICLDDVEQVGLYAELEIMADESSLDSARSLLLRTAAELGLVESERRSYLELLLAAQAASPSKGAS